MNVQFESPTKNLTFCPCCLKINGFEDYNETLFVKQYEELKELISKKGPFDLENICFEGGGIRTIGYIGALHILEDFGLLKNIKRSSGTSAGSLFAMLVALGYTVKEMYDLMNVNFTKYEDRSRITGLINILFGKSSLYTGQSLESDIKQYINKKFNDKNQKFFEGKTNYNPTLKDLHNLFGVELITTASNLTYRRLDYFSPKLTPDIPIYLAVRMSMSLPFVFEYVEYNGCVYIDGGICNNLPLNVFHNYPNIFIYCNEGENILQKSMGIAHSDDISYIKNKQCDVADYTTENMTKNNVNNLVDYIQSIISLVSFTSNDLQFKLINLLDSKSDCVYFKKIVEARVPHLTITDFAATTEQKNDAITIFKISMLKHLYDIYKNIN